MAEEEEEDEDHNLTPADAEDLLVRAAPPLILPPHLPPCREHVCSSLIPPNHTQKAGTPPHTLNRLSLWTSLPLFVLCCAQLRLAAEQEVSPLSMDSAYDPSYVMDLSPRPVGGEGPVM